MGKKNLVILFLILLISFFQVSALEFCKNETNETGIEITQILNEGNNWDWLTEENAEISVKIQNKNYTQRNFELDLFFYNKNEQLQTNFTEDNITKIINLNISETQIINFTFKINDMSSGTYLLYARLKDETNESICKSLKAETETKKINITVTKEESLVVIRKITGPTEGLTGSKVKYIVEVLNLGTKIETQILAIIYNQDFGIREEKEIFNLGIEETKNITFNFTIPKNATAKNQSILFALEFDYNNKTALYQIESLKDERIKLIIIATPTISDEQNQTIQQNQTSPQTTQNNSDSSSTLPNIPYLWITLIIILTILIILALFFYFKRKDTSQIEETKNPAAKVNEYLKKITGKPPAVPTMPITTVKSPTTPNRPSGTNTANTNIPPTSQSPPQQPRSPTRPATASSSPKPTPAHMSVSPPTSPNPPQKNQPSPLPPKPNKTSSP